MHCKQNIYSYQPRNGHQHNVICFIIAFFVFILAVFSQVADNYFLSV